VSLVKKTCKEAGLQRHPSHSSSRKTIKFIVSVDLIHLSFNLDPRLCEAIWVFFKEKKKQLKHIFL
jgi:ribonuclease P/MRP protein subunit RPP40